MAVRASRYGPIVVADPARNTVLYFKLVEGPMVNGIFTENADVCGTTWHATPGDATLFVGEEFDTPNATWKELFTELLSEACCSTGIAIHHITKKEHKMAVEFLLKCGLLDKRIPYHHICMIHDRYHCLSFK